VSPLVNATLRTRLVEYCNFNERTDRGVRILRGGADRGAGGDTRRLAFNGHQRGAWLPAWPNVTFVCAASVWTSVTWYSSAHCEGVNAALMVLGT
jgi:hypothetical protein